MFVVTGRVGERIPLVADVALVVKRVSDGRVTLGIEAPDGVPIVRDDSERSVSNDTERTMSLPQEEVGR